MGLVIGLSRGLVLQSASDGLAAGLVGGAVTGGLFPLAVGTLDLLGDREARPGEPSGPRQAASVQVRGGPDLPERITAVLSSLPSRIRVVDLANGHYTARTKWTWRSFGEEVSVRLTGGRRSQLHTSPAGPSCAPR